MTKYIVISLFYFFILNCLPVKAGERVQQWSCYKILEKENQENYRSKNLQELALAGDKNAAYQLAQSLMKVSEKQNLCWLLVAAENGNANAQYNLWVILKNSTNYLDKERALFWLKRSADQKFPPAVKDKKSLIR